MTWMRRTAAGATALLCLMAGAPLAHADPGTDEMNENAAQEARQKEWWLSGLGIDQAAKAAHDGDGVKICMIDMGVDPTQEDLKGAHFADGKDISGYGSPDGLADLNDDYGHQSHGTAMAAWIVGQGHGNNHGTGILGVAPKATLMSVSNSSKASSHADEDIGKGVKYCADHGAKVISMSIAYQPPADIVSYALQHDAVVVIGAGNNPQGVSGHQGCGGMGGLQLGMITVGGITKDLKVDPDSCTNQDIAQNRDEEATGTSPAKIIAAAPSDGPMNGAESEPLVAAMSPSLHEDGMYQDTDGGTSTATAITSGVVALVRAAHPELKAEQVIDRMTQTYKPIPGAPTGDSAPITGGIINPVDAVSKNLTPRSGNPMGDPSTGDGGIWTNPQWNGSKKSSQVLGSASPSAKAKQSNDGSAGQMGTALLALAILLPLAGIGLAIFLILRSRKK